MSLIFPGSLGSSKGTTLCEVVFPFSPSFLVELAPKTLLWSEMAVHRPSGVVAYSLGPRRES